MAEAHTGPTVARAEAAAVQDKKAAPLPDQTIPGRKPGERTFDSVTIPRGEMVGGTATGDKTEHVSLWDNRLQHGGEVNVTVEADTVEKDFTFLSTYVSTLADNENLAAILSDPRMEMDKLIMESCAKVDRDPNGKPIRAEVDNDKVQNFLQSSKGIATLCMLTEDESLLLKWGLGMDAVIKDQVSRGQKEHSRSGKTTRDSTPTIPGLVKPAVKDAVLGLMTAGYFVTATGRTKTEFGDDDALLYDVITENKTDSVMVEYLKARTGGIIDLKAINATRTGAGTPADPYQYTFDYDPSYNPDIDTIKTRVTNADKLRRENLKQLGFDKPDRMGFVSRDRQIRYLEEFILSEDWQTTRIGIGRFGFDIGGPAKAEDLPVTYVNQILSKYRDHIELARATGGHPPGWEPSRYERLNLISLSRREIMVQYLSEDIAMERAAEAEERKGKDIEAIKEKGRKMEENPEAYRAEKRKKLTDEIKDITEKRDAAEKRRTELIGGPDGVAARSEAVQDIIDELETDQYGGVEVSVDMPKAIKDRKDELQNLIDNLPKDPNYKKLLDDRKAAMDTAEKDARTSYSDAVSKIQKGANVQIGTIQEAIDAARVKVEQQFKSQLDPYETKYNRWKRQLEALEAKERDYTAAVRKETGAIAHIRNQEPHLIQEAQNARNDILGIPAPVVGGAAPFPDNDAIRKAKIDDIVNAQKTGTPEEKLQKALLAKAAAEAEETAPTPKYQQDALTEFVGLNVLYTPDYVLRLGVDVIIGEFEADALSKKPVGGKTLSTDEKAEIRRKANAAFKGAALQMRSIAQTRADFEVGYYDAKIKEKQKDLEKLGDFKETVAKVHAVVAVLENATVLDVDNTLSRAAEIADDPAKLKLLTDTTTVAPKTDGFTEAETALKGGAGEERRVYEWYRLLYPQYVRDPEKRDEMFNALALVFPPDKLRAFLGTHHHDNKEQVIQTTIQMLNHIRELGLAL